MPAYTQLPRTLLGYSIHVGYTLPTTLAAEVSGAVQVEVHKYFEVLSPRLYFPWVLRMLQQLVEPSKVRNL
ncbi:uncharacterized protein BO66DRAFT_393547 [Aspergillus aculeatinus CBS 121060]|uniref:Uncharacterized protein n=1 Tax=Aspergillus aculeatinus CBS 121060 TaxID=1448322 RepID=A0ACD1H2L9_9EURO|nr:hypothetical protein BO66DRAFT_393547 [Aspergillus aculeatinus CBS 121060]RAH67837.1 hypothetical protein BO66DRAFT_393547 [Aspergillus aculeatinus CBS 121060]